MAAGDMRLAERWTGRALRRAIVSLALCVVVWEIGARCNQWFGFKPPWLGDLPAPTAVLASWWKVVQDPGYWRGWVMSAARVLGGFTVALAVGIPLGLSMAVSRTSCCANS